jgi:hypothetical protein
MDFNSWSICVLALCTSPSWIYLTVHIGHFLLFIAIHAHKSGSLLNFLPPSLFGWLARSKFRRQSIREFTIYDAVGSTTRSEFQLKNER